MTTDEICYTQTSLLNNRYLQIFRKLKSRNVRKLCVSVQGVLTVLRVIEEHFSKLLMFKSTNCRHVRKYNKKWLSAIRSWSRKILNPRITAGHRPNKNMPQLQVYYPAHYEDNWIWNTCTVNAMLCAP